MPKKKLPLLIAAGMGFIIMSTLGGCRYLPYFEYIYYGDDVPPPINFDIAPEVDTGAVVTPGVDTGTTVTPPTSGTDGTAQRAANIAAKKAQCDAIEDRLLDHPDPSSAEGDAIVDEHIACLAQLNKL